MNSFLIEYAALCFEAIAAAPASHRVAGGDISSRIFLDAGVGHAFLPVARPSASVGIGEFGRRSARVGRIVRLRLCSPAGIFRVHRQCRGDRHCRLRYIRGADLPAREDTLHH